MTRKLLPVAVTALLLTVGGAHAETVEIYLAEMLDNIQNGYCIDISGGQAAQADPGNGLQGHTCYSPSGKIFVDQGFHSERVDDGMLYMPAFNVCAEVSSDQAGAAIDLAECNGSEAQRFVFTGEGTIASATAPKLCLTLGEATRSGRSDRNQIKELSLEACSGNRAAYQTWSYRTAN